VKGCVLVNTTLPLFSEQSREVFYFSGCGFRFGGCNPSDAAGANVAVPEDHEAGALMLSFFPCTAAEEPRTIQEEFFHPNEGFLPGFLGADTIRNNEGRA